MKFRMTSSSFSAMKDVAGCLDKSMFFVVFVLLCYLQLPPTGAKILENEPGKDFSIFLWLSW